MKLGKWSGILVIVFLLIAVSAIAYKQNLLGSVQPLAIVSSGQIAYAGDTFEYTFTLTNKDLVSLPELDTSDNVVTRLYKGWRITDPVGGIASEGVEEISTAIAASGTTTVKATLVVLATTPSGKEYGASAILFKVSQTWDRTTNTWTTGSPTSIDDAGKTPGLAVKFSVQTMTPPPVPTIGSIGQWFSNLFSSLWAAIKSLFGWI